MPTVNDKSQNLSIDLVLDNFRVTAGEGLNKTERSDRPRFMIAPDQREMTAAHVNMAAGRRSLAQAQGRHMPRLGCNSAQPYDEDKDAGEVMIKLRVGNALRPSLPIHAETLARMMIRGRDRCLACAKTRHRSAVALMNSIVQRTARMNDDRHIAARSSIHDAKWSL